MRYIILLFLLSAGLLTAQSDRPTFGGSGTESGTFTGSNPSGTRTRDKGMGFGKKAAQNASTNARLQQAREQTMESMETNGPVAPDETTTFDESAGMGLYYLETGESLYEVADYLEYAREELDLGDGESVLGLISLYGLLAEEASTAGDEDLANSSWTLAEDLIDDFFADEPSDDDALLINTELGYMYYELGYNGTAGYFFDAALDLDPGNAYLAYMVASCRALDDLEEEALDYLDYALSLGLLEDYPDVDIAEDSDFDSIRETSYYRTLAEDYGFE
ncbi:tetratricopeptide (TPR) repeat protein [Lewinella aquimaris]|uniref:Tetratricopeptide (TPR) repeat protein n=1 Tax=Neolewinella aquimaris TaxID=1835722 RepID=A0A840E4H5_9BACT|nr:hypothetical protein [Neolewinella aquimaris]MBB4080081.1 tetratricopeptide (TPR) repeat protein [Neolewinella aquimaris]